MAKSQAIAITGQAILALLANNVPVPEFNTARFELYQTASFNKPLEEGISLFLYRLEVNPSLRNLPAKPVLNGDNQRPPLPLDLYYLLTAWAKDTVRQQRLLGWAMRVLEDAPVLSAAWLNQQAPEPDIFRQHETVELIFHSINLQDASNLWSALKISPPLSVGYIARVVGIESPITAQETFPPVQTRDFEMAKN